MGYVEFQMTEKAIYTIRKHIFFKSPVPRLILYPVTVSPGRTLRTVYSLVATAAVRTRQPNNSLQSTAVPNYSL